MGEGISRGMVLHRRGLLGYLTALPIAMGLGNFGFGNCCCSRLELWACHDGTTQKIDDGALYSWAVGCSGGPTWMATAPCDVDTLWPDGVTLWIKDAVVGYIEDGNVCWSYKVALTKNVGGAPVLPAPGAWTTFDLCDLTISNGLHCDADDETEIWNVPLFSTLACMGATGDVPITFGNYSGVTCSC